MSLEPKKEMPIINANHDKQLKQHSHALNQIDT